MTSWVPLGWISWNVDDIIALELYNNKMHILIILLQVILDNKDWTEVYKLVTTEKKSSADPTIVPNGQNHFQNIILPTILIFFFLTVFHEHRSTPLTGITGRQINEATGQ